MDRAAAERWLMEDDVVSGTLAFHKENTMTFDIVEVAKSVMKRDGMDPMISSLLEDMFAEATVEFVQQDSFSIAMLTVPVKTVDGIKAVRIVPGVSKRDTKDAPLPKRGKMLALVRAIRRFIVEFRSM